MKAWMPALLLGLGLSGCQTNTLYIAEQGRPEGLTERIIKTRSSASDWTLDSFNNRFNPPRINAPLVLYGSQVDKAALQDLLGAMGLIDVEFRLTEKPGHRATERNAVLYFPLLSQGDASDEEMLQFSVTCGYEQVDIYTRVSGFARLSFSRWLTEKERWQAIKEEVGRWQKDAVEMRVWSDSKQYEWRFGFNIDPEYPLTWRLKKDANADDGCWGYVYHEGPNAAL